MIVRLNLKGIFQVLNLKYLIGKNLRKVVIQISSYFRGITKEIWLKILKKKKESSIFLNLFPNPKLQNIEK